LIDPPNFSHNRWELRGFSGRFFCDHQRYPC
jgi:hypothetical protein